MKPTILVAILFILLGFGAEFDEYVFYKASFQVSEIAHHEVIAIALWCLGIGVIIGSLLQRTKRQLVA